MCTMPPALGLNPATRNAPRTSAEQPRRHKRAASLSLGRCLAVVLAVATCLLLDELARNVRPSSQAPKLEFRRDRLPAHLSCAATTTTTWERRSLTRGTLAHGQKPKHMPRTAYSSNSAHISARGWAVKAMPIDALYHFNHARLSHGRLRQAACWRRRAESRRGVTGGFAHMATSLSQWLHTCLCPRWLGEHGLAPRLAVSTWRSFSPVAARERRGS